MSRKLTALLLAILMLPFSAMNTVAEGEPDLSINEISFTFVDIYHHNSNNN